MPDTTTCMNLPYPLDTDRINVALDIKNLATKVDTALCGLDGQFDNVVLKTGSTMTTSSHLLLGHNAPTSEWTAMSKHFSDLYYLQVDGTNAMKGQLTMNGGGNLHPIVGVECGPNAADVGANQAITKSFADARYINKTGDQMTADLNMGGFSLLNLAPAPPGPNSAVPRDWANSHFVDIDGDTMTGNLTMFGAPADGKGIRLSVEGWYSSNIKQAADGPNLTLKRGSGADADGQPWVEFTRGDAGTHCGWIRKTAGSNEVDFVGHIVGPSDYRLKERVGPIADAAVRVSALAHQAYRGHWLHSANGQVDFLNAHDIAAVAPYAVRGDKDGDEMQTVDFPALIPLLVAAVGELAGRVAQLERSVA